METRKEVKFFLGANSKDGFYSLYDDFVSPECGDFLWVIKGGPGSGKSSFMKKIASAAEDNGLEVEYIHCSADPDSLDGIYIPEKKVAYVDGTAPHVQEPKYPGIRDQYLDLGAFYRTDEMAHLLPEITELKKKYKALYDRAYASLAAAAAVSIEGYPTIAGEKEHKTVLRRASGAAAREFGKKTGGAGRLRRRFLSAITCKGRIFLEKTIDSLCDRVYTLDNEYGLADLYLSRIIQEATRRGVDCILCPDPLCPEKMEALLVPDLRLGFVTISSRRGYVGEAYRHIRLDAIIPSERIREVRPRFRSASKLWEELIQEAVNTLSEAKVIHDQMEELYNPYLDFSKLYELADKHIEMLLQ
jgi:hypothetical protein